MFFDQQAGCVQNVYNVVLGNQSIRTNRQLQLVLNLIRSTCFDTQDSASFHAVDHVSYTINGF
ncbi:hypothetical protein H310_08280 [Aphanomyces invadans]|uniref:Uncharacterized protein n=1 Tax=Aphanomyces invadans TaxID=157072 RepID=A0A024U152_9STRA|nr:hypothetical protein H310_08280 [Aphanomyces invadans]ETV99636.1 hypothetical protein H310_08280 [Aphanomyces invadans]|eukprot:XP_008872192.1 hypothetical protein H310_08280 [Aphanomyces invadans]